MLLGGVLTALTVALEIYANHLQITYYLVLILLFIGLVQFIKDLKANNLADFAKRTGILLLAALLASGTSFTRLATTMEYGKESTRGKSELTTNLDNKTTKTRVLTRSISGFRTLYPQYSQSYNVCRLILIF